MQGRGEPEKAIQTRFVSIEDAARLLAVSHWTIRRAIKAGDLVAYKVGSVYRVEDRDLRQWVGDQRFVPLDPVVVRVPPRRRARSQEVK
jgi:excisionase family DNA binding protein